LSPSTLSAGVSALPQAARIGNVPFKNGGRPREWVMEHHLQALVFIIYFVANIVVLYHVHQSRLLEDVD
jgi:hypothetical protein